jgi:hypothetical protein
LNPSRSEDEVSEPEDSGLRGYLEMIQIRFRQIREAVRDIEHVLDRSRELAEPPEKDSQELQDAYDQAMNEVGQCDDALFRKVRSRIITLQRKYEEFLAEACWLWEKKLLIVRDPEHPFIIAQNEAQNALKELNRFQSAVETTLQNRKSSEIHPSEGQRKPGNVRFKDNSKEITLGRKTYRIEDSRAYDLFKLVAEANGAIVPRRTIRKKIKGLLAKNAIANCRKKLPEPLQRCLKSIKGREGGLKFVPPK